MFSFITLRVFKVADAKIGRKTFPSKFEMTSKKSYIRKEIYNIYKRKEI